MRKRGNKSYGGLINVYWDIREHPIMKRLVDFKHDLYGKMLVLTLDKSLSDYHLLTVLRTSEKCFRVHFENESVTFRKGQAAQAYMLDKLTRYYDFQDFKNSLSGQQQNLYFAKLLKYEYPYRK